MARFMSAASAQPPVVLGLSTHHRRSAELSCETRIRCYLASRVRMWPPVVLGLSTHHRRSAELSCQTRIRCYLASRVRMCCAIRQWAPCWYAARIW